MRIAVQITCSLIAVSIHAQDTSHNYVKTVSPPDSVQQSCMVSVQYLDGLGRPVQTVSQSLNPYALTRRHVEYDGNGRKSDIWLDVPGDGTLGFLPLEQIAGSARSLYADGSPKHHFEYDALGRNAAVAGPGDAWAKAGAKRRVSYGAVMSDSIPYYYVLPNGNEILERERNYAKGELMVKTEVDEDGIATETITDVSGKTVITRTGGLTTRYVYDTYGLLRFVLTPAYCSEPDLEKNAYEYRYDRQQRCVWKRCPGCEPVTFAYDSENRIMAMQDGTLRSRKLCRFFVYDAFGREALRGTCSRYSPALANATAVLDNTRPGICGSGYDIDASLLKDITLEKATYYDCYLFTDTDLFRQHSPATDTYFADRHVQGMRTGEITATSDGGCTVRVTGYDSHMRVASVLTAYDNCHSVKQYTEYSFTGKPTRVTSNLYIGGKCVCSAIRTIDYDTADREKSTVLDLPGKSGILVSGLGYGETGRVTRLSRGSDRSLATSYSYNIRGWQTFSGNSFFQESTGYESGPGTPRYGGCASSSVWHQEGDNTGGKASARGYTYSYDNIGRLVSAEYGEGADLQQGRGKYDESVAAYSATGQPLAVKRCGMLDDGSHGLTDDLTLTYDGNRLVSVSDAAPSQSYENAFGFYERMNSSSMPLQPSGNPGISIAPTVKNYSYDGNGSLTSDPYKCLSFDYDNTGMPRLVKETTDGLVRSAIKFVHDADGVKTKVVRGTIFGKIENGGFTGTTDNGRLVVGDSTLYVTPEFECENGVWRYRFDGGYATLAQSPNGDLTADKVFFYITDRMGAVRSVVEDGADGAALRQYTAYYPFGGPIADRSDNPGFQARKYSGKEYVHNGGLDMYDFGARLYDPALMQFRMVDRMAEKYYPTNAYVYCLDNPLRYIDPDGNDAYVKYEEDRASVLSWINSLSVVQFAYDCNKLIETEEKLYWGHSQFYSDMLLKIINDDSNFIYIQISDYTPDENNIMVNIEGKGGATTVYKKDFDGFVDIYVSNRDWTFDEFWVIDTPALKVMHEIVGHAVPKTIGLSTCEKDAIDRENSVREDCNFLKRLNKY